MDRRALETTIAPIVAGLTLLLTMIGLLGTATHDPRPHDIPVGLSAPAPVSQQLTQAFDKGAPEAFRFTAYESEAAVRAAIDGRDVVAGLVVGPAGPRLMVAGAAGDAVTGGVTGAFTNAFRAQGMQLAVETVHPFQAGDPHGIALFFLVLSTLISSLVVGALLVLRAPEHTWMGDLGVAAAYAVLAGICGSLATAVVVDGYGERLWHVMGLTALLSLAVVAVTAASARILGPAGVALAGFVLVLLGLVSSGGPLGSELLPDAYRTIAPWLPAGPAYSALRGALYFDGAGVMAPVLLLSVWSLAGIATIALADLARPMRRRVIAAHA